MISEKIKAYFDKSVDVVFGIILVFIIFGIAIGTAQLFFTTWKLLAFDGVTGHCIDIIADVLTLYVLIELSRSLVEYFNTHKLRLTFIVDAAIVFYAKFSSLFLSMNLNRICCTLFRRCRINEIVHGMRTETSDTAIRLALGTSEQFWMGLHSDYDQKEAINQRKRILTRLST